MSEQDHAALGAELAALLRLGVPPIGIAFRAEPETPGVAPVGGARPSPTADGRTGAAAAPCVFWFLATERTFSTVAEDHANCSVGSYTHGFKSLAEVADKADVAALVQSGWVGEADFPNVPAVKERPGSIVYGPLDALPVQPDVVFLRLNGQCRRQKVKAVKLLSGWMAVRAKGLHANPARARAPQAEALPQQRVHRARA